VNRPDPLQLVGRTIADKYIVEALVGEGGFALVYRAQHSIWKRPVALKVFHALQRFDAERQKALLESFVREGSVLAELSERSAAIVQARDIGTLEGPNGAQMPFMVLEWLDGASLDVVLANEKARGLPPRTLAGVVALLDPVAQALRLAHSRGIAHRDLKPANVFLVGDPRGNPTVKILDFGIAKVLTDAERSTGAFMQTQGQVASFTPAYGAPEQFSRAQGATGPWTDVFALALMCLELLTHAAPLLGDDVAQVGFAAMDPARRPTPGAAGVPIPPAAELVFQRAVAVRPADRFPDAGTFWGALRNALSMAPMSEPRGSVRNLAALALEPVPPPEGPTGTHVMPGAVPLQVSAPRASTPRSDGIPAPALSDSMQSVPGATAPLGASPAHQPSNRGLVIGTVIGLVVSVAVVVGAYKFLHDPITLPPPAPASASASGSAAAPPLACPVGMVEIPGGTFFMGSDDKTAFDFEKPAHKVQLSRYCIDKQEVSLKKFMQCAESKRCKPPGTENVWEGITGKEKRAFDQLCNASDAAARGKHPANCVDWAQARDYCVAQGKRLPTEAEWEFAARGSDGRTYPWGEDAPSALRLNACGKECVAFLRPLGFLEQKSMYAEDDGWPGTAPVGSFPKGASPFGVEDMVGNVWEWVSDLYAPYSSAAQVDPQGDASGTDRVIRGGGWNGEVASWVRPTFRYHDTPSKRSHGIGFRCAKPIDDKAPTDPKDTE
jgi:formylglycine-generating enzyme required for sulfatase activity